MLGGAAGWRWGCLGDLVLGWEDRQRGVEEGWLAMALEDLLNGHVVLKDQQDGIG